MLPPGSTAPARRAGRLWKEMAKDDEIARAGSELEGDGGDEPRGVHMRDLLEDLAGGRKPDEHADDQRADDRGAQPVHALQRPPAVAGHYGELAFHAGSIFADRP
jgi:hypothetical protein